MLHIENIKKSFVLHQLGRKVIEGFDNVYFSVAQGTSLGISGPSGIGKSSVLKCIYRTYTTTSGSIWYESSQFGKVDLANESVTTISRIREGEIGTITQFLKVIPRISARDIVAEPLITAGIAINEARARAEELLIRLGIPSTLFDAYPSTFSGGEQQRVNIARAVIKMPRLLILDEPTASLDSVTTGTVLQILQELRLKGCTMIGIFHQQETLCEFSDSIYVMPGRRVS